jgi:hypothetical protein
MSLKLLSCLVAVLLVSVCGAFAAPSPEASTAPAVAQPMSVEDFVQGLGEFDPSQPMSRAVVFSCEACSSNATCVSICSSANEMFCQGTCKFLSDCQRKVCFCQLCP